LKKELEVKRGELDGSQNEHKTTYSTLIEEIKSLMPMAVSTGLATAYKEQKESFRKPIIGYSALFFASITLLIFIGSTIVFEYPFLAGLFANKGALTNGWTSTINALLFRLPLSLPLIWLAYFASKRRSEYNRLQQEYAHKEVLAKSFQSYKTQIEGLSKDIKDDELINRLLKSTIDTIGFNASATLDKKHGDKTPIIAETPEIIKAMKSVFTKT